MIKRSTVITTALGFTVGLIIAQPIFSWIGRPVDWSKAFDALYYMWLFVLVVLFNGRTDERTSE